MLMKVWKWTHDTTSSKEVEMQTELRLGQKIYMEYDWCKRIPCMNGYKPEWHKGTAEFTVVDIVCNMLINPCEIWVRLRSDNAEFIKRCECEEFEASEQQILSRITNVAST